MYCFFFLDKLAFQGTGIAVGYTGGSLLTAYVAYLSPWMPPWLWMAVGLIMVLGVAITATSSVGAIATLAPKPHAFKIVSKVLSVYVYIEACYCSRNCFVKYSSYSGY